MTRRSVRGSRLTGQSCIPILMKSGHIMAAAAIELIRGIVGSQWRAWQLWRMASLASLRRSSPVWRGGLPGCVEKLPRCRGESELRQFTGGRLRMRKAIETRYKFWTQTLLCGEKSHWPRARVGLGAAARLRGAWPRGRRAVVPARLDLLNVRVVGTAAAEQRCQHWLGH